MVRSTGAVLPTNVLVATLLGVGGVFALDYRTDTELAVGPTLRRFAPVDFGGLIGYRVPALLAVPLVMTGGDAILEGVTWDPEPSYTQLKPASGNGFGVARPLSTV